MSVSFGFLIGYINNKGGNFTVKVWDKVCKTVMAGMKIPFLTGTIKRLLPQETELCGPFCAAAVSFLPIGFQRAEEMGLSNSREQAAF